MAVDDHRSPPALFIRLTDTSVPEKGERLANVLQRITVGDQDDCVFERDLSSFAAVPGSPIAYWAAPELLEAFVKYPQFESEGRTARQGLATADDFRFVRLWWEVAAGRLVRGTQRTTPDEFRYQTRSGRNWVPFAKGGEFAPYFADLQLVVFWDGDGTIFWQDINPNTGNPRSNIWQTGPTTAPRFFFRPGLTWPRRTNGFSVRAMPSGSIFADKGPAAFHETDDESHLFQMLETMNSSHFLELIALRLARTDLAQSYEVGVIQSTPFIDRERLSAGDPQSARRRAEDGIQIASKEETKHVFLNTSENHRVNASPLVGLAFARWDIRIAKDRSLAPKLQGPFDPLPVCAPAMLVGPDGLPARTGGIVGDAWLRARPDSITLPLEGSSEGPMTIPDDAYPLPIPWDGLLIDDVDEPDHPDGLLTRMRMALAWLHGDEAPEIERQLAERVGSKSLSDYLRKPGGFFADHLTRYSKSRRQAPIYWPLSTPSGSFTVWVYYPRLTSDTLYRIDNQYLQPKLVTLHREIEGASRDLPAVSGKEATLQRERLEGRTARREELLNFQQELLRVAGLPYRPDHDDGVILCAAPLWRLFRLPKWSKATREAWEKLERGDYEWAHLAMAIWPDRVLAKCRSDRSLAIAHDREDLYVEPPPTAGKKGKIAFALPLEGDEEDDT